MSANRHTPSRTSETGGNGSRRAPSAASDRADGLRTPPRHARSSVYRRLLRDARPYAPRIATLTLLSLLATPLALLLPVPLKVAVDSVIGSQPPPAILDDLLPTAATQSDTALLITVAVVFVAIVFLSQLVELGSLMLGTHVGERLLILFGPPCFCTCSASRSPFTTVERSATRPIASTGTRRTSATSSSRCSHCSPESRCSGGSFTSPCESTGSSRS